MKKILIIIILTVLMMNNVTVFATPVKTTKPAGINDAKMSTQLYSLLGNRLLVSMPEGSKVESTPSSKFMAPQSSNERETRISYKVGSEELILYARELFCYSKTNLLKDVNHLLDNDSSDPLFKLTYSSTLDGLPMVLIKPLIGFSTEDGTFVYGAVVKQQDGNLISVYIYANEDAYKQQSNCNSISSKIINSLKRGTRTIATSKRNVIIDNNIVISVENGYVAFVDVGKDFNIYNFVKIVPIGGYWSNMGIYSGKDPVYAGPTADSITQDGVILGKKVKWEYNYYDPNDPNSQVFLDTLVEVPIKDSKTGKTSTNIYHIFIDSDSSKDLEGLKKMANSMKFILAK